MAQDRVQQFMQQCRDAGLSVTPQRLAIYKCIMDDASHPNPESIYRRLQQAHPTISFATVYKTLETFEKHGIIRTVTSLHNTVRYDPVTVPHHHIVCTRCKKVVDLMDDQLNEINVPEAVSSGNQLLDFSIQFNVICAECRQKN